MIVHGGIGVDLLRSLRQVFFRQIVFSQPEICPAQRIQISAVGGIEIDRLLDVSERLFQLHVLVGQHVAEIIQCRSMLRIARQHFLELLFRLGIPFFALKG